jgi:hypothetical protein
VDIDINSRNVAFVNFAAACLGWVSPNFRRIDYALGPDGVHKVRIVLREESAKDRQSIQEILDDFEAMRLPPYDIKFDVQLELLIESRKVSRPSIDSGYLGLYASSDFN